MMKPNKEEFLKIGLEATKLALLKKKIRESRGMSREESATEAFLRDKELYDWDYTAGRTR